MNERKPQPAWRKKEGGRGQQNQQQQQRGQRGGRRPPRDQKRDNRRDQQKLIPLSETRAPEIRPIEVTVRDGNVDQALRVLKTRMSKEGVLSEVKRKRHAEKPSEKKRRKHREAMKRMRKSKGRKRRQDWWKRGRGRRSNVVASVPIPDRQEQQHRTDDDQQKQGQESETE
jgi:small subunit ribosomal protein S21